VAEIQKFMDQLNADPVYPVDWIVHDVDCDKMTTVLPDGKVQEIVYHEHKFKKGVDRYKARCLKWKSDPYFTERNNERILDACKNYMVGHGYSREGHEMHILELGLYNSGKWAIGKELLQLIKHVIPRDSEFLELGSGFGTHELAKSFKMTSIESYSKWVGLYDSAYIHAPLIHNWFNPEPIKDQLKPGYAGILVDGPPGSIPRAGFLEHMDLFDTTVWIFFDDIHRTPEYEAYIKLCDKLKRKHAEFYDSSGKAFGVIEPKDIDKLDTAATFLCLRQYTGSHS
jgi:hypothetical protein